MLLYKPLPSPDEFRAVLQKAIDSQNRSNRSTDLGAAHATAHTLRHCQTALYPLCESGTARARLTVVQTIGISPGELCQIIAGQPTAPLFIQTPITGSRAGCNMPLANVVALSGIKPRLLGTDPAGDGKARLCTLPQPGSDQSRRRS